MTDCIDCGKHLDDKTTPDSICPDCLDKRVDELTPEKAGAMSRVGLDALIDEVTGYQQKRPKGDLKKRYEDYLKDDRH